MSYNTKNYVEQGGERLVIGGEMEFKEGARVTGLPTAIVLDFHGQSLNAAFRNAIDVTEAIPLSQFLEATRCESPIILRGIMLGDDEVGVQGMATMTGQGIFAMAGYNGNGASLLGVITLLLYQYDDKVWLVADSLIPFEDEYVDGVNVYPDTMTMVIGNEQQITAEVIPDTAVNKATHWSSSDESVVTLNVTPDEYIDPSTPVYATAVGAGNAEITVTTDEGGYTATCYVTVDEHYVEEMAKK